MKLAYAPLQRTLSAEASFGERRRRERDSNPRSAEADSGFRDRPIRPLWHLSQVNQSEPANDCLVQLKAQKKEIFLFHYPPVGVNITPFQRFSSQLSMYWSWLFQSIQPFSYVRKNLNHEKVQFQDIKPRHVFGNRRGLQ